MRFLGMVVTVLGISFIITTESASADTASTDIKNEIGIENEKYSIQNDPFLINMTFGQKEEKTKTPEEIKYEETLNKWKQKQTHLWKNLPNGQFTVNASAYTASADECGNDKGITASGIKVQENRTLACPPAYPFGTKIRIEGMGTYTCEDRGGAIQGNHFDIYMQTKTQAFQFGRRNLLAEVVQ